MLTQGRNYFIKNIYVLTSIIILIITGVFLFIFKDYVATVDADITYHVSVAESFIRDGGISTLETWDSLPLGRPHLYPPVLHIFISPFLHLGFSPHALILFFSWSGILFLLSASWLSVMRLFNSRVAFFYILLAVSFVPFLKSLGVTLPASIVFCLSPYLLILMKKGKTVASVILLTLLLYTHMIFPWFVVGAFFLWGCFNKIYFKKVFYVISIAILLYLPWLIHILSNIEYLRYFAPGYVEKAHLASRISFNLNILFLFTICLVLLLKKWRKNIVDKDISYFIALIVVASPVAYFEFVRYGTSIGGFAMMIIIAFTISEISSIVGNNKHIKKLRIILLSLLVISFTIYIFVFPTKNSPDRFAALPRHNLFWESLAKKDPFFIGRFHGHVNEFNIKMAENIKINTPSNGVILNLAHTLGEEKFSEERKYVIAQLFASLSNRKMGNQRYPEVHWRKEIIYPAQADIVLVNDDQIDETGAFIGRDDVEIPNKFEMIDAYDKILVLKNLNKQPFIHPKPHIVTPLWIATIVLFGAGLYIIHSIFKKPKIKK